MKVKLLSRIRLLATPWTAAYQAPPSMGFSRQEYWSGVLINVDSKKTNFNKFYHVYNFIYFWLNWVFIGACRLSLVIASGNYSVIAVHRLLIEMTFLFAEYGA